MSVQRRGAGGLIEFLRPLSLGQGRSCDKAGGGGRGRLSFQPSVNSVVLIVRSSKCCMAVVNGVPLHLC